MSKKLTTHAVPAETMAHSVPPGVANLLAAKPIVINVGLQGFTDELVSQGVTVTQVDWSPPAGGDARLAGILAKLGT